MNFWVGQIVSSTTGSTKITNILVDHFITLTISFRIQRHIICHGVLLRLLLKTLYRKTNWTHFSVLQHAVKMYRELMKLETLIATYYFFINNLSNKTLAQATDLPFIAIIWHLYREPCFIIMKCAAIKAKLAHPACQNALYDPILLNICFNYIFYLL